MKIILLFTVSIFISVCAIGNPGGGNGGNGEGKAECPPGYRKSKREGGRWWCSKYFSGNETFFEAEKICRCQGGATLSGIENTNELKWVMEQAESAFEEEGTKSGGILVGAYRRKECRVANMENKTACTKEYQYQWTDRNTQGNYMWVHQWAEGAPHNNIVGSHSEFCVQLQVSIDDVIVAKNRTSGYFDNRVCVEQPEGAAFPTKGFLCGRPAKIVGGYDNNGGYGGGNGGVWMIGAAKPTKKP